MDIGPPQACASSRGGHPRPVSDGIRELVAGAPDGLARSRIAVTAGGPESDDKVVIGSLDLPAGTRIRHDEVDVVLPYNVMEGHRIVVSPVADGEDLLSWSTPVAGAYDDLVPGDPEFDGVVPVAHTEAGQDHWPKQRQVRAGGAGRFWCPQCGCRARRG